MAELSFQSRMEQNQQRGGTAQLGDVRCAGHYSTQSMSSHVTTPSRRTRRHAHKGGLRTVAVLEALKGALALASAYFLIILIRRDVDFEEAAEHVLFSLHISPSHHWSQEFLHAADKISGASIAMIAAIAITYAALRFTEGYGLWRQRAWAEWLAIISGCAYLPFEIYKVIRRPNELHWAILGINILVVLYIAWVRWDEITASRTQQPEMSSESD
jgi:uncharacterized membrane protein (DUF2068 family)